MFSLPPFPWVGQFNTYAVRRRHRFHSCTRNLNPFVSRRINLCPDCWIVNTPEPERKQGIVIQVTVMPMEKMASHPPTNCIHDIWMPWSSVLPRDLWDSCCVLCVSGNFQNIFSQPRRYFCKHHISECLRDNCPSHQKYHGRPTSWLMGWKRRSGTWIYWIIALYKAHHKNDLSGSSWPYWLCALSWFSEVTPPFI